MNDTNPVHAQDHAALADHAPTEEDFMHHDREPTPPSAELRVGDLHLTLRRRPARFLADLGALVLGFTGWFIGQGGNVPLL